MRHKELEANVTYAVKVSGKICPVRIDSICEKFSPLPQRLNAKPRRATYEYICTNLRTGRTVIVKSCQRFRGRFMDYIGQISKSYTWSTSPQNPMRTL